MAFDYDRMPLVVRQLRVQHGSKRQRDLAAVRMAEELQRLQTVDAGSSCEALRAWVVARKKLRRRLGAWSIGYRSYIRPLRPLGLDGDALVLDGGEYTKRRYSHLIGEALDGTGYAKVHFVSPEGRG